MTEWTRLSREDVLTIHYSIVNTPVTSEAPLETCALLS